MQNRRTQSAGNPRKERFPYSDVQLPPFDNALDRAFARQARVLCQAKTLLAEPNRAREKGMTMFCSAFTVSPAGCSRDSSSVEKQR